MQKRLLQKRLLYNKRRLLKRIMREFLSFFNVILCVTGYVCFAAKKLMRCISPSKEGRAVF